jgi:hypothetical protein
MSGTLRPFDLVESKFKTKFDSKIFVTPDLVKWRKKLLFCKLSTVFGNSNTDKIKFTYQTRNDNVLKKNVISFITSVSQTTKEGVLVFFPSYTVLEIYANMLRQNQVLRNNLKRTKQFFFEKKGESVDNLMRQFKVRVFIFFKLKNTNLIIFSIIANLRKVQEQYYLLLSEGNSQKELTLRTQWPDLLLYWESRLLTFMKTQSREKNNI